MVSTDPGNMPQQTAAPQASWRQWYYCCLPYTVPAHTWATVKRQYWSNRHSAIWMNFDKQPWTTTNNLTLIFPALYHCWSNHSNCNIHGDVYSKWFLGFSTNQLVLSCNPPLCKPVLSVVLEGATASLLKQVLPFPRTLPAALPQPGNIPQCDFDLTHSYDIRD